ncbi:MAG: D-2-hydroxyacid dehydrogenase [Planctomycetaceae bacterium]|nr:D-2-hydroxyacid dehydrogenase [Planctomycetaceae bacterium]
MKLATARFVVGSLGLLWSVAACSTTPAAESAGEFGSLRNTRVAIERPQRELTYFAGALEPGELEQLAKVARNVRVVAGLSREQALERAQEADGVDARFATAEFLAKAPNVRWVQSMSAGVDRYMGVKALVDDERIVMTNQKGAYGPAIADHVFGMVLSLARDLRFYAERQQERTWARGGSDGKAFALQGRTLLVLGLGGIGGEVAVRGHAFGMRVLATRRTEGERPAWIERVGKPEDTLELLAQSDVVVLCVPLTAETENLIDAHALAAMKPGAMLVNIARGKVVDTQALLAALESGHLGGACLDVTEPEPLPKDHPLWAHPRVLITPHIAADGDLSGERAFELLSENLRRFGAGEPLLNVVDKKLGY